MAYEVLALADFEQNFQKPDNTVYEYKKNNKLNCHFSLLPAIGAGSRKRHFNAHVLSK